MTAVAVPLSALAEEWNHNYAVNGKPEIVVDTNDGDVDITPGSSAQVSVRVTVRGIELKEMNINGNQVGNRVEIKVHRPNHVCIGFCFQEIRILIQVPPDSDL